jgi:membrane dipeptidase
MITRRHFLGYSGAALAVSSPTVWSQAAQQNPPTRGSVAGLPAPRISAQALAVHRRALVFDGHVHALDREFYQGGSFCTEYSDGQWDLVRAREGGVGAFFCSIYVPEPYLPGRFETKQAFRRIDHALRQIEANRDTVELALKADDVLRIRSAGKIAAVLDIEGSYDLDGDLGLLRDLYRLGLRSAMLSAHNANQNYADSCCTQPKSGGLTEHGRAVIHEMNRLGMIINVSHAGDQTISQAIDVSDHPLVATHGGMRSVVDIPRCMPDDLMQKLASKGGVFGFQIGSDFNNLRAYNYVWKEKKAGFWDISGVAARVQGKDLHQIDALEGSGTPMVGPRLPDSVAMTVDEWVDVVDKAIQLIGEDHVSLGSDFDGGPPLARGMRDVRDLPMITDAMLRRGYSEQRIDKFWGGNLLRVFRQVTQNKS